MKKKALSVIMAVCAIACGVSSCSSGNTGKEENAVIPAATVVCDGVTSLEIDSVTTLVTLRDNAVPMTKPNSLFYGKDGKDSAKVELLSPSGEVASSIHAFLVKKDNKLVLFDTGVGSEKGGMMLARLDSAGFGPENVDYIILTHCHSDHIGGLLRGDSAVFARAEVFVPQVEYNYWSTQSSDNGKLAVKTLGAYGDRMHQFLYTDTAALPLGIRAMAAVGHTPGHTAYKVGGRLMIAGDLMHGYDLQKLDLNISPSYDMNPEQAAESRKFFMQFAKNKHMVIAGMHLPGNGVLIETE